MPHVHGFPVAPLSSCGMSKAGADEHRCGVAVREGTHAPDAPAALTVEAFNDVVRADPRPVFRGEITAGQRLLNADPIVFAASFSFIPGLTNRVS